MLENDVAQRAGRRFFKMSGSGNDFVFFDRRQGWEPALEEAAFITQLCARGTGVGADGVVVLGPAESPPGSAVDPSVSHAAVAIRYFNADGSRAALCGNATLCTASLAARLGAVEAAGGDFGIDTDAGVVTARIRDGEPEFDLPAPEGVALDLPEDGVLGRRHGEQRLGFAVAGVPHVVVLVPDVERTDVSGRGRAVRHAAELAPAGANVNFVSRCSEGWAIRTYERGVEGETLACGTGSAATAVLLAAWGLETGDVSLRTRSGRTLVARLRGTRDGGTPSPLAVSLRGEGRLVYTGDLEGV